MSFNNKAAALSLIGACLLCTSPAWADPQLGYLEGNIPQLRALVGKSLLETVVETSNSQTLILEKITPQGATFFLSGAGRKDVTENFDGLRKRNRIGISFTTCSGTKALADGKIIGISAWENLSVDEFGRPSDTPTVGFRLQRLLELMNTPASVTTPSTMRTPKAQQLHGVVFEYVKGDSTEDLSVTNDADEGSDTPLRANWSIANTSYCPKS